MTSSSYPTLRKLSRRLEEDSSWPRPLCPVCGEGYVAFGTPEVFENSKSAEAHHHEAWEPEWIFGTFRSTGRCENLQCQQTVTAVGTYRVELAEQRWGENAYQYSAFYSIEHFSPALYLLRLPDEAPEEVREATNRAARLLFIDPGLAATALRASVERFLSTLGIPASDSKGGFLSLHRRLDEWKKTGADDRVVNLFLAVKWIGNEGTHEVSDLTVDDVLDGVDFIDEAFHHLFVAPDIDARAKGINVAKGRPKKAAP